MILTNLKKKGYFTFGEDVENFEYKVFNDRAVRATAGLMLAIAIFGFTQAFYLREFLFLKTIVVTFFVQFLIAVFLGTKLAPYSILGSFIVRKQKPEWVGAVQKKFAWSLGLFMASTMILLIFMFNVTGFIPLIFCFICMALMWLESSFGICVGCKIYWFLVNNDFIAKPNVAPVCPGGACPMPKRKK